ncbi:MAG: hypothetical protein K0A95_08940 [Chromatiales bacterium]|nr:hypothetical protein [Gammaproteobacteria bacterium]MBW6477184.1 hypothetical protein [Chromatiales bacterium]
MTRLLSLSFLATLAGSTLAHPGHGLHGHDGFSLWHYLSEPDHVVALVLLLALIDGLLIWLHKCKANTTLHRQDSPPCPA